METTIETNGTHVADLKKLAELNGTGKHEQLTVEDSKSQENIEVSNNFPEKNGDISENVTSELLSQDLEIKESKQKKPEKEPEPETEPNLINVQAQPPEDQENVSLVEKVETSQNIEENLNHVADDSSSQTKNLMSGSLSVEFTYTSLDEVKSDSDEQHVDDAFVKNSQALETIENKQSQNPDSIDSQLNGTTENLETVSSCSNIVEQVDLSSTNNAAFANENGTDEEPLKKLSFDSVIERVKSNRVTNKEVCNYVLNLLVSGEFDLEKNFVIQNVKSILLMIQVIKCATPSLKVSGFNDQNIEKTF